MQGVPNFMINQFEIPPFMLPIYQACGTQYSIPWNVLASIHKIESAFGTNMGPSTAGAVGQMQFLPSTWQAYGVDANRDGRKDPYNPLDAVCAAGRYLKAAGGEDDLERAIFAYNHADWYVDEVLLVARQYGRLPDGIVGSLTGLTEGAHFPVAARATYADDLSEREILKRTKPSERSQLGGVTAETIESSETRRGINIFSREGLRSWRSTTARSRMSAARRSSAATSSSRTRTATASPMPVSVRCPSSIRSRSRTS